jgi:hypothetical protein
MTKKPLPEIKENGILAVLCRNELLFGMKPNGIKNNFTIYTMGVQKTPFLF